MSMSHVLMIGGGLWLAAVVFYLCFCASARQLGHEWDRNTRAEIERMKRQ